MGITWIEPITITPGVADAYTDCDVSAYIAAGATGVILHTVNTDASSSFVFGCRKNGSTDARERAFYLGSHQWVLCGVDANRVLELYVDDITSLDIYLVGYFDDCAVFNTNAVDKSTSTTGSYVDIDISVNDGAIAAMVEVDNPTISRTLSLRKNGSTDDRYNSLFRKTWAIVGVDNDIFEVKINSTSVDLFILGYIKSGIVMLTNAVDLTPATTGSYVDLTALPGGATGGFIEVFRSNLGYSYALRKNGSSEDIARICGYKSFAYIECDESQLIEAKIASAGMTFFLVGYAIPAVTSSFGKVNIDGVWKDIVGIFCNIDGTWKTALSMKSNIGGVWK